MGTTPVAQPLTVAALNDPAHYAALVDSGLNVPAIPVEQVPPDYQRQLVAYETDQPVGTIIINPSTKHLYLVTAPTRRCAMASPLATPGLAGRVRPISSTARPGRPGRRRKK